MDLRWPLYFEPGIPNPYCGYDYGCVDFLTGVYNILCIGAILLATFFLGAYLQDRWTK